MLIRQLPFRGPWPSSAASTVKVPETEPRSLRFRPARVETGQTRERRERGSWIENVVIIPFFRLSCSTGLGPPAFPTSSRHSC